MISYSDEQEMSLESRVGNNMTVAGPGAGKSTMLKEQVRRMIHIDGVDPCRICMLSFSNAGKDTMAAKFKEANIPTREKIKVSQGSYGVFNKTIDGLFYQILNANVNGEQNMCRVNPSFGVRNLNTGKSSYNMKDGLIMNDQYKKMLINHGLSEIRKGKKKNISLSDKMLRDLMLRIDLFKANGTTVDLVEDTLKFLRNDPECPEEKLNTYDLYLDAYKGYELKKREAKRFDFSDLSLFVRKLINNHPDVLVSIQSLFDIFIIDEFQDTSESQFELLDIISRNPVDDSQNMFMIGDPNQSIYGWRGAKSEIMINIENYLPEVKRFKFTKNFRSEKHIIEKLNNLTPYLATGKIEFTAAKKGMGNYSIEKLKNQQHEGVVVAAKIADYLRNEPHLKYSDFAVIYRTNAQSLAFEVALERQEIPYKVSSGKTFWEHEDVQIVLGYLEAYRNTDKPRIEWMANLLKYPDRGINSRYRSIVAKRIQKVGFDFGMKHDYRSDVNNAYMGEKLNKKLIHIYNIMKSIRKKHVDNMFDLASIVEDIRVEFEIESDKDSRSMAVNDSFLTVIDYMKTANHGDVKSFIGYVQKQLARAKASQSQDDAVSLVTGHTSKGLEFDTVFVAGAVNGYFPSEQTKPEDMMDERNLFFVAISRAMRNLHVTYFKCKGSGTSTKNEVLPSRFLKEMDPKGFKEVNKDEEE